MRVGFKKFTFYYFNVLNSQIKKKIKKLNFLTNALVVFPIYNNPLHKDVEPTVQIKIIDIIQSNHKIS